MSTNKPRLTITLEPEGAAVLERLARLQKRPKARVLVEILESVWPTLDRVADTLELATRAQQGAKEGLVRVLDEVEAKLRPMVQKVTDQYDRLGAQLALLAGPEESDSGEEAALPAPVRGGRKRGQGGRKDPRLLTRGVTTTPQRGAAKRGKPSKGKR